jgi:hypothetical protein
MAEAPSPDPSPQRLGPSSPGVSSRERARSATGAGWHVLPLAVLLAFFVLLFREALFGGRFLLVGDPLKQLYPLRTVAWEMIRDGHLPLWLPHILSGYPSSAMAMLGLGYPLTWGYLVLPGWWAEQLYVMAPYFLAPVFTYAFLREWGRSREASVLGGLTFGYGGFLFSPIGLTGVHANSALWLPLLLLGIARARRRPMIGPLLLASAAYAMSILAGSGQLFLYTGALGLGYGLFLSAVPDRRDPGPTVTRRWPPLLVAGGAIVLAAALTAFQTFETWTAVHQSVREAYPASRVEEGSFPPVFAWHSLLQPLGNFWDSSTFVPPLALLFAIAAVAGAGRRSSHVYFWAFVAVFSWILILGTHTPLFELYARVPFVGLFRYPSRHSFEWSFAIAVLAAYGWDGAESRIRAWGGRAAEEREGGRSRLTIAIGAFVLLAALVAVLWERHAMGAGLDRIADLNHAVTGLDTAYLAWKVVFILCLAMAVCLLWQWRHGPWRAVLLMSVAAFSCYVETRLWMVRPVVAPFSVSRDLFGTFADATEVLRTRITAGQRTFSLPHPYTVSTDPIRDVDAVNWTALAGLEDVNGYESLILSRYSRALTGDVDTEPFVHPDARLMGMNSRVLDLLSVGYVVAYANFSAAPEALLEKDGVAFSRRDIGIDLQPDRALVLPAGGVEADALALVTTLGMAVFVAEGEPVARVLVTDVDGRVVERDLLAGIHTAEFAHGRPDVKRVVRHALAPIFDSTPGDATGSFQVHRFLARLDLGERMRVRHVELTKTTPEAGVGLWKATLHDAASGTSVPLPQPPAERWQAVYERNGVVILENLRALPRAWLVARVEVLDESDIVRRIRGESDAPFDPRTTALLEPRTDGETTTAVEALARAGAAKDGPSADVRTLHHEPARIVFETDTSQPAMLVASEIDYPGWVATLDGTRVPIHRTNYLLRGVVVPPGRHTIEMRYLAPGLRRGARVSFATIVIIVLAVGWRAGLTLTAWRGRKPPEGRRG